MLEDCLSSLCAQCAGQQEVSVHQKADGGLLGCKETGAGSHCAGCSVLGHMRVHLLPTHGPREAHGRLLVCSWGDLGGKELVKYFILLTIARLVVGKYIFCLVCTVLLALLSSCGRKWCVNITAIFHENIRKGFSTACAGLNHVMSCIKCRFPERL